MNMRVHIMYHKINSTEFKLHIYIIKTPIYYSTLSLLKNNLLFKLISNSIEISDGLNIGLFNS